MIPVTNFLEGGDSPVKGWVGGIIVLGTMRAGGYQEARLWLNRLKIKKGTNLKTWPSHF